MGYRMKRFPNFFLKDNHLKTFWHIPGSHGKLDGLMKLGHYRFEGGAMMFAYQTLSIRIIFTGHISAAVFTDLNSSLKTFVV
jgi:hypothetical protein